MNDAIVSTMAKSSVKFLLTLERLLMKSVMNFFARNMGTMELPTVISIVDSPT